MCSSDLIRSMPYHREKGRIHKVEKATGRVRNIVNYDGHSQGYGYRPGISDAHKSHEFKEEVRIEEGRKPTMAAAVKRAEASRQRAIKRAARQAKRMGGSDEAVKDAMRDHDVFSRDEKHVRSHLGENQQIDELSRGLKKRYREKAKEYVADKRGTADVLHGAAADHEFTAGYKMHQARELRKTLGKKGEPAAKELDKKAAADKKQIGRAHV